MKTIYFAAATLDGYIADQNDSLTWLFKNGPTDIAFLDEFNAGVGAIAMGSATYRWLLENSKEWAYKVPCFVFTHGLYDVMNGADVRFVQGDVALHHGEMKRLAGDKNVWIMGGGDLAGQFYDKGLIDEMHIQTVAVFLNEGKKLFARKTDRALRIKDIRQRGETCVEVIYSVS